MRKITLVISILCFLSCARVDEPTELFAACDQFNDEAFSKGYYRVNHVAGGIDSVQIFKKDSELGLIVYPALSNEIITVNSLTFDGEAYLGITQDTSFELNATVDSLCDLSIRLKHSGEDAWRAYDNWSQVRFSDKPSGEAKLCSIFSNDEFVFKMSADSGGPMLSIYDSLVFHNRDGLFYTELYLRGNKKPEVTTDFFLKMDTLTGRNKAFGYDHSFFFDRNCTARMVYKYDGKDDGDGSYRWIVVSSSAFGSSSLSLSSSSRRVVQSEVPSSSSFNHLSSKIANYSSNSSSNVVVCSSSIQLSSSSAARNDCKWMTQTSFAVAMIADSGGTWLDNYDSLLIERSGNYMESKLFLRGSTIPEVAVYLDFSNLPVIVGRNAIDNYDNRLWFNETCTVRMDYRYDSNGDWEDMYRWVPKQ